MFLIGRNIICFGAGVMTIKARLLLLVSIAVISLIVVSTLTISSLIKFNEGFHFVTTDLFAKIITLEELESRSEATQKEVRQYVLVSDTSRREQIINRINEASELNKKAYEYLVGSITSERGKSLLSDVFNAREKLLKLNDDVLSLAKEGKVQDAIESVAGLEAREIQIAYSKSLKALVEYQKNLEHNLAMEIENNTNSMKLWSIVVASLSILALLAIALVTLRSIIGAVNDVVLQLSTASNQMLFKGRLAERHDELNAIAVSMNQLFSVLENGLAETNKVVTAISKADFNQRMIGHYVGDLEVLRVGVNGSAESVAFMMTELEKVMNGLNAGQFNVRMDSRVPHAFRSLVETAMQSMNNVITDINHVMKAMNEGDFDARVNALAYGDLLSMKNNVNDSMDRLSMAVTGITTIVSVQANGDLTRECTADFRGQLKQLQDAINNSSRKLKSIVAQAVDASQIVNEAALQVSQGSSDLSSRVQEQAAALEQTSATMHEMASAVQNNTANARKVADLAHQVQHQAGEGVGVMQQTIGAMQSIHEASSKISDIVSIIDGIAFQTNLLALNAAVEAARAGEHGRGFAVVASEVRALAQKSAEAAKDIKGLIDDSVQRVENGTQLAEKSGSVLNGITASIEQVAGMVEEIATASNEQSTGISQVHNAMADIDRVTQENAALVEETTAAAESLSSEAKDLRESMAFFKTGQQSNAHYHQPKQKQAHKSVKSLPSRRAVPALPAPNSRSANEWSEF